MHLSMGLSAYIKEQTELNLVPISVSNMSSLVFKPLHFSKYKPFARDNFIPQNCCY